MSKLLTIHNQTDPYTTQSQRDDILADDILSLGTLRYASWTKHLYWL